MNQILENIYTNYSVYFIETLLLAWIFFLYQHFRKISKSQFTKFLIGLMLGIVLSSIIFHFANVNFKILSDETNLLSVSRAMVDTGKMFNTIDSIIDGGVISPVLSEVPTRGAMFPYFVAVLHRLRSISVENVFVLNFLSLSFLISFILYLTNQHKFITRLLFIISLVSTPVIFIFSTSGGFDLFSFCFAVLNIIFLKHYLNNPNKNSLNLVVFTSLCFSNIRYESIVGVVLILAFIVYERKKDLYIDIKNNYFLFFAPVLMLPFFIQRYLTWGKFENPIGTDAFSFYNLYSHLGEFFKSWFYFLSGPYPILFHWIGLFGIFLTLKKKSDLNHKIYKLCFSYVLFLLILLLAHHLGKAMFPTQVRLFMPISAFFIFSGYSAIEKFLEKFRKSGVLFFVAIFLIQIIFMLKYSIEDTLTQQLTLTRETQSLRKILSANDFSNVQFIYDRPGQFYAFGYAAASFSYLTEHNLAKLSNVNRIIAITRVGPENPTPIISSRIWKSKKLLSFELTDNTNVEFQELSLNL